MPTQVVLSTFSVWRFWLLWMLATFIGAVIGLVLSFPFQVILEAALGGVKAPPWTTSETILIMACKGAQGGMMGLGVGLGQWWIMRKYFKQMNGWIFATGLAFFLQGAFRWSLPYDMLSQQVGISITLSFGIFLGLCQWFALRGHVPHAESWITISIAGWLPALALFFAPEFGQILGMVLFAISLLVPFAVAGAGMIWLLRQGTTGSRVAPT